MTDKLTKIALSGDDFDAFSKALDNPSEPNEALKSLFAGHIADLLERCGERIGGGEPNTFTDEIYDAVDRLRAISAALDRDASQVRDSSQQSSDMVERVARILRRSRELNMSWNDATLLAKKVVLEVIPFRITEGKNPWGRGTAYGDAWEMGHSVALEASHHAKMVEVLERCRRFFVSSWSAAEAEACLNELDALLAKIGGGQ